MAYQSDFFGTPQLPESNKFVEITNDSRFPPVSVIKWDYRDSGYSLSSVDIFSKYAVVTYLANPEDIKVSLSAENINVNLADVENILNVISPNVADIEALLTRTNTLVNSVSALLGNQLGANGVVCCQPSDGAVAQNFTAIQVLSACKFSALAIANSTTTGLINYEFPQNFVLTAPITSLTLSYGAVIAFKA